MKSGHGEKQSRLREQAIAALLAQPTIGEAARVVGIGEETLRRWLTQDEFAAEYRKARRSLMGHAAAQLQKGSEAAVHALVEIVADPEQPAAARVSSARTILELAVHAAAGEDLDARVSALEQEAAERAEGQSSRRM